MAQYIGTTVITSVVAGTNCSGGGSAGIVTIDVDDAPTFTGAAGITIKDTTTSSATEGGNLILASDDGAVMADNHRLGVIEFKGAEDTSNTLTNGARIQAIADAAWSASENGASLQFYTTDADASESVALTLDSDNLATFAGNINATKASGDHKINASSGPARFTIESPSANGNDVYLGLKSSDTTWLLKTNRGDQISGNQGDFFIREDTAGVNALILETNTGNATFAGDVSIPKRKMSVSSTTDGNVGSGDIIYFGTGSSVVGKIYHYKSDGSWELADANAAANCDGLLAVAIGTDPDVDGMLIRGMVTLIDIQGTEAVGDVLYLSESATGAADCVAPAGNLDIIRVIGYCLSTDDQVWFDPDKTFVEVTA